MAHSVDSSRGSKQWLQHRLPRWHSRHRTAKNAGTFLNRYLVNIKWWF